MKKSKAHINVFSIGKWKNEPTMVLYDTIGKAAANAWERCQHRADVGQTDPVEVYETSLELFIDDSGSIANRTIDERLVHKFTPEVANEQPV